MSNGLSLFEGNPLANSDLFKSLQDMNDKLAGSGGGTYKRISIRGGRFRRIENGEQIAVSKDDTMNIVIIDAAPVSRTYYAGAYEPDKPIPPSCWSENTERPHPSVTEPQASRCGDCPQNIKGSGQGNSRACRFAQRLAVVIENDMETVYQLQLPATSLFGEAKENAMPMQSYAKLLKAYNTPAIAVVTEMRFDEDSEVPKLYFRPLRPLTEEELGQAVALRDSEEVKHALEFTVSQTDGVQQLPAPDTEVKDEKVTDLFPDAEKPKQTKAKPKKAAEEKVEEPTKVVKKTAAPPPEESEDLEELVGSWDDE